MSEDAPFRRVYALVDVVDLRIKYSTGTRREREKLQQRRHIISHVPEEMYHMRLSVDM